MAKRQIAPLVNGRVRLRLLSEADLPMTLAWRNQDHIRRWFFHSEVITPEQHQAWWERYQDRDDDLVFVIEELEALRRPVGQVALYNIEWAAGRGEFGRLLIGEAGATGLGLATLATERLVREALGAWGLSEIFLEVVETNARAVAVYTACGFAVSGRRDGVLIMTKAIPIGAS